MRAILNYNMSLPFRLSSEKTNERNARNYKKQIRTYFAVATYSWYKLFSLVEEALRLESSVSEYLVKQIKYHIAPEGCP